MAIFLFNYRKHNEEHSNDDEDYEDDDDENEDDDDYEDDYEEPKQHNGFLAQLGSRITIGDTVLFATIIANQTGFMLYYYVIYLLVLMLYIFLFIEIKNQS